MTRVAVPQVAFSSGELSPLLHRRYDYQRYQTGMRSCRGFLPLRQGGFTRAPGTLDRGATRNNLAARLMDFEFAENDAVVLEFTDLKMRVWRYGQPVLAAGVPYEIATPYNALALPLLTWVQTADVIWIADGFNPVHQLRRFALDNWTLAPAAFTGGPFRVQNLDTTKTVQANGTTGTVRIEANFGLFDASHIGGLFRVRELHTDIPLWSGNTAATAGSTKMRNNGRTYLLTVGANTGINPPTHEEGEQRVSFSPDVRWLALDDGVGVARIVSLASATSPATAVNAQVLRPLPQGVVVAPTYRWEEGAWSPKYGYPSLIETYEQRLVAAASPSDPRALWFSAAGGFDDFTPGVEADDAFTYVIAGSSTVNRIIWLARGKTGLHVGALGEEYSTRTSDRGQAIGPATAVFGLDSSIGGRRNARPIAPDGRPIFISKDTRRVFEIAYSFQEDANVATELSLPADHLGDTGFQEIAWQGAPMRIAWARRGNGELALMVHDPSQEVLGWAPLSLAGGAVESMAVTADATGTYDVLTMVVRRTVGGLTVRRIEELAPVYGIQPAAQPIAEAVHLFAALTFVPGAPAAVFSVPHLVGEEVHAWTDAGEFGPLTVAAGGAVTLPVAVNRATIGLFDATHVAETLDLLGEAPDGKPMGRPRRLSPKVKVGLHRTAAGTVAAVGRELGQPEREYERLNLVPRGVAADLTEAFSGVTLVDLTSGHETELSVRFRPSGGAPMTITALVPPIAEAGL